MTRPQRPNLGTPIAVVLALIAATVLLMSSCAPHNYPVTKAALHREHHQDKELIKQFRGQ